jgi:hypothetical protein
MVSHRRKDGSGLWPRPARTCKGDLSLSSLGQPIDRSPEDWAEREMVGSGLMKRSSRDWGLPNGISGLCSSWSVRFVLLLIRRMPRIRTVALEACHGDWGRCAHTSDPSTILSRGPPMEFGPGPSPSCH